MKSSEDCEGDIKVAEYEEEEGTEKTDVVIFCHQVPSLLLVRLITHGD